MTDITLCVTEGCPMASSCRRKLAAPGIRQAYAAFDPERDGCYWPS